MVMHCERAYTLPFAAPALILAMAGAAFGDDEFEFKARLTGDEEVPQVVTDTSGRAKIEFSQDLSKAEFVLRVSDGTRLTQAHIHCAPVGSNGPIVAFLAGFHELGWDVDGKWIDNATLTDDNIILGVTPSETCPHTIATLADLVDAIIAGDAYVNVHSDLNQAGEVRGQLELDDD
jgi:CHRD domain